MTERSREQVIVREKREIASLTMVTVVFNSAKFTK